MRALVGSIDGQTILRAEGVDVNANAEILGIRLAEQLLSQGAAKILEEVYNTK